MKSWSPEPDSEVSEQGSERHAFRGGGGGVANPCVELHRQNARGSTVEALKADVLPADQASSHVASEKDQAMRLGAIQTFREISSAPH